MKLLLPILSGAAAYAIGTGIAVLGHWNILLGIAFSLTLMLLAFSAAYEKLN